MNNIFWEVAVNIFKQAWPILLISFGLFSCLGFFKKKTKKKRKTDFFKTSEFWQQSGFKEKQKISRNSDSRDLVANLQITPYQEKKNFSEELIEKGGAYTAREYLMTPAERDVYRVLEKAYGERFRIFCQVRVVDIIQPNTSKHHSRSREFMSLFRQLSQWYFDYVLCERENFKIFCALELDDASHERADRVKRDRILDMACKDAGLELKRIRINHQTRSIDVVN